MSAIVPNRLISDVCGVLSTLAAVDDVPASMVYLALGSDIDRYNAVSDFLVKVGWVKLSNNLMNVTDRGRELADKIDAMVFGQKQ